MFGSLVYAASARGHDNGECKRQQTPEFSEIKSSPIGQQDCGAFENATTSSPAAHSITSSAGRAKKKKSVEAHEAEQHWRSRTCFAGGGGGGGALGGGVWLPLAVISNAGLSKRS